jgi:signal transduction histidine kinase
MIERSSSEMETIVEQFVEFASLDHERTQVRATAVPVAARYLIEQAISLAGESISSSGLEIDVEYDDPDCEVRVMSDRMCRCFHQIIENASKFAGAGCRLKIGSRIDSNIVFRFEDNGPGIASDELARVFDLFHQIDRDDTGEVPGLGLGLWWVREIVRVHGGNVVLTSPVANRRGRRVDVVLPLKLLGSRDAAALSDETDGFETLHAAEIV